MIKILDESVVSKIAAGEVVERPASVVKEFLENALDAGATHISVAIEQGGKTLIRVTDNGIGVERSDLELSIKPHATSKIVSADDLFHVSTYGFRGEALAAIAAVSQFRIASKVKSAGEGYEISHDATGISLAPTAAKEGTTVTCRNLFYNIPARQKFLESEAVEFSHILDTFTNIALIHPEISFSLTHNNRLVSHVPAHDTWTARIEGILGKERAAELLEVRFEAGAYRVHGFISAPRFAKERARHTHIYINKRPVRDFLILKACKSGYGNLIMERLQPDVFLDCAFDRLKVDVNVHPRKLEVKHERPQEVFAFIERAVSRAVPRQSFPDRVSILDEHGFPRMSMPHTYPKTASFYARPPVRPEEKVFYPSSLFEKEQERPPRWRILGQLHHSYILLEKKEGLILVDQHAAAERITYEKLAAELQEGRGIAKQQVLVPIPFELSNEERHALETYTETLRGIGFEIARFGGNAFVLQSVPAALRIQDPVELVLNLLHELKDETVPASLEEIKKKALDIVACRSAIKFGDSLTVEEQKGLIETLEKTPNNQSCIHGRPVFYTITLEELARWFKRK